MIRRRPRKARGVVARFLAGESSLQVSYRPERELGSRYDVEWAERLIRRALRRAMDK